MNITRGYKGSDHLRLKRWELIKLFLGARIVGHAMEIEVATARATAAGCRVEWPVFRLFYERLPEGVMPRKWHAVAYRDVADFDYTRVMVIWPFNYAVQCCHWLSYLWDRARNRRSWIDKQVDARVRQKLTQLSSEVPWK